MATDNRPAPGPALAASDNRTRVRDTNPIRVLLADPQPLVRAGIRLLVERVRDAVVIGEVNTGRELLDALAIDAPDIVLTELAMPELDGIDITRRISRHLSKTRVLVLSSQIGSAQVRSALRAGVAGFLSKSAHPVELELALRAVHAGHQYLSPQVARFAIEQRRGQGPEDSVSLSTRQREVLRLVGRGKSTKEIAGLLGVSAKTIETHRLRLMQALNLSNINALVHYAVRHELQAES